MDRSSSAPGALQRPLDSHGWRALTVKAKLWLALLGCNTGTGLALVRGDAVWGSMGLLGTSRRRVSGPARGCVQT